MSMRSTAFVFIGSLVATLVAAAPTAEASCIPGFDFAAFSDAPLVIGGGAVTNSYDSSLGTYAATTVNSGGDVCTNSTGADSVKFNGSGTQVYGNVCVGTGGTVPSNINAAPGQYLSSSVLPTPVVLTAVTVPIVGTNQGDQTYNSNTIMPPNQTYGNVTINAVVTLNAGTYVMNTLNVGNSGYLNIGTGPVIIYLSAASGAVLDVKGEITNAGLKATDLAIMVASNSPCTVKVNGGATAAYALYAPKCDITVNGNGTIYGAIVGRDVKITGGAAIHYDAALKNLGFGAFACIVTEVARSTPIIATVSSFPSIIQGTYEYPFRSRQRIISNTTVDSFRFPYVQGHLRASKLAQFGTATVDFTGRSGTNEVFDAATLLPPADMSTSCTHFTTQCRTVFTSSTASINPIVFNTTNATTVAPLITAGLAGPFTVAQQGTITSRIVAGNEITTGVFQPKLGGLDRSTVAVIPRSLTAGSNRPTIIYVGGTDGMLHAFCGSVQGPCSTVGEELWAFVPRVLLQQLRENLAIIDGSARVIDAYGDFDGNVATTTKSFATILLFTTGTGDRTSNRTPAVYALDITNPGAPKIVWEYTMTSVAGTAGTFQLGHGQMISAGPVLIGGVLKIAAFIQTNNGAALKNSAGVLGSGSAGSVVTALDIENVTTPLWTQTYAYPLPAAAVAPRLTTSGPVPMQAVPGGAVVVDQTNSGTLTDVVFGTIYGNLWVLDATTGVSRYAGGPLFQMKEDFQPIGAPPAIFSDGGSLYAVGTTGSYWDRSSATMWNANTLQWVFAVKVKTLATVPLTEADAPPPAGGDVPFATSFGGGQKSSAQALVVGGEIVFLTDTGNINSAAYGTGGASGTAHKMDLDGGNAVTDVVVNGVGGVAVSGADLFSSSGKGTEQLAFDSTQPTGEVVNGSLAPKVSRRLWLRTL